MARRALVAARSNQFGARPVDRRAHPDGKRPGPQRSHRRHGRTWAGPGLDAEPVPQHVRRTRPGRPAASASPWRRSRCSSLPGAFCWHSCGYPSSRSQTKRPLAKRDPPPRPHRPHAPSKVEMICIIDAINDGTLVYRSAARQVTLPRARILRWAKRAFEWKYLRRYR
jgi:hypothetical protein